MAEAFGISVKELYEAAGYGIAKSGTKHVETPEEIIDKLRLAQPESVPLYSDFRIHAGQVSEEPVDYIYRARTGAPGRNLEAFIVHGTCMEPEIKDGNIVVVDRDLPGEPGDVVLCLINDELHIGKLRREDNGLWLRNKDKNHNLTSCQMSAVVIEVIKRLKYAYYEAKRAPETLGDIILCCYFHLGHHRGAVARKPLMVEFGFWRCPGKFNLFFNSFPRISPAGLEWGKEGGNGYLRYLGWR